MSLFVSFFKCGLFAFGGGSAAVPMIENEIVSSLKLLSYNEFSDAYALGNALPGPIVTKLATIIGFRSGGFLGVLFSILGLILPSSVGILLLFSLYQKNKSVGWVNGMLKGVKPIVSILILNLLYKSIYSSFALHPSHIKHSIFIGVISILGFISFFILKLNPIILIISSMILGGFFLR